MFRIILLPVMLALCGCGRSYVNVEDHQPLAESLSAANAFRLYEGLPHQTFEPQLLEAELQSKETIEIGGFPFYSAPLKLNKADRMTLVALIRDVHSFGPIDKNVKKACGGFHPDYCLSWQVGTNTYHALLCFGCVEIKAMGGGVEVHWNIHYSAYDEFNETLKSYRKNRPISDEV